MTTILKFEKELAELINKHSLENMIEMPDFLMANLIVSFLRSLHIAHLSNNDWHGMKAYSKKEIDKEIIDRVSENCSHIRPGCEYLAKKAGNMLSDEMNKAIKGKHSEQDNNKECKNDKTNETRSK